MAFRSVLRPSSPPSAKASTKCPYRAHSHHAQKPSMPCSKHALYSSHASERSMPLPVYTQTQINQVGWVRPTHRKTARPDTHQPIHTDKDQPSNIPTARRTALRLQEVQFKLPNNGSLTKTGRLIFNKASTDLVEADGFEPTTPCLQSRCSPS